MDSKISLIEFLVYVEHKKTNFVPQIAWNAYYKWLVFHPKYLLWTLFKMDIFKMSEQLNELSNYDKNISFSINQEQMQFIEDNYSKIHKKSILILMNAIQKSNQNQMIGKGVIREPENNFEIDILNIKGQFDKLNSF